MDEQNLNKLNDRESLTLDYTAKGFANWTIRLKADIINEETIKRLVEIDEQMRIKFPTNVMSN